MLKAILAIVLIVLACFAIYEAVKPMMSNVVTEYCYFYQEMSTPEYQIKLFDYVDITLRDPIAGLNYTQLIYWVHNHLNYTTDPNIVRTNMPIDILKSGVGRCGEFALLYNGLCIANGYNTKLVIDESSFINKSKSAAGDHVWVEVWDPNFITSTFGMENKGKWITVEITQSLEGSDGLILDQPHYYRDVWNKDVNLVTAIKKNANAQVVIEDVTAEYE